jgi:class 3 adenylate cyclase
MDFILKRKAEVEATGRQYWSMRIGIHCGPVVSGVPGVKRVAFDIWGNTVNPAARMRQSWKPERINLSISFCDMLAGKKSTTGRGAIPIKNCGEMEMCFFENFAEQK